MGTDLTDDALGLWDDARDVGSDLGYDTLDPADKAVRNAFRESGVPAARLRFLFGKPPEGTVPTAELGLRGYITQAGHVIDNLQGPGGPSWIPDDAGKWAAAEANQLFGTGKKDSSTYRDPDMPVWHVDEFHCTEGLSQLFKYTVTLRRVEENKPLPERGSVSISDAIPKMPSMGGSSSNTETPKKSLPESIDTRDPDQIDTESMPDASKNDTTDRFGRPMRRAVDPADFIGQRCAFSIARRARDHFTLTERWFTGIGWAFEDRGYGFTTGAASSSQGDSNKPAQSTATANNVRTVVVEVRPRLYKLSLRAQCRVFQSMGALAIIKKILEEHGIYQDKKQGSQLRCAPPPWSLGPIAVPGAVAGQVQRVMGVVDDIAKLADADIGSIARSPLSTFEDRWTAKREYCVQYNETDLDFVLRLMEEEGITFYFEHAERLETLVLCDDPFNAGRRAKTVDRGPVTAAVGEPTAGAQGWDEQAWGFVVHRCLIPGTFTVRDYNFSYPTKHTEVRAAPTESILPGAAAVLAVIPEPVSSALLDARRGYSDPESRCFEYPGRFVLTPKGDDSAAAYDPYGGPDIAKHRMEAARVVEALAVGTSRVSVLTPGERVDIRGGAFDVLAMNTAKPRRFLVTSVEHEATSTPPTPTTTQQNQTATTTGTVTYQNTFRCVMGEKVRYRPAVQTPKPRVAGLQTATVLDAGRDDPFGASAGDPAKTSPTDAAVHDGVYNDRMGRVLVRFHWDRRWRLATAGSEATPEDESKEPAASAWVRVRQPLAGASFGAQFVPRRGMEVLVDFLEGDPDRPVIVGALYNGWNSEPPSFAPDDDRKASRTLDQPARKTASFLRSRSVPRKGAAGSGFNEVVFDDHGGAEKLTLRAQQEYIEKVGRDRITSVKHVQRNTVGRDQTETVGADQTLKVTLECNDDKTIGRDKVVRGDESVTVGTKEKRALRHEDVLGNDAVLIDRSRTVVVEGAETAVVKGRRPERPGQPTKTDDKGKGDDKGDKGKAEPRSKAAGADDKDEGDDRGDGRSDEKDPADDGKERSQTVMVYGSREVIVHESDRLEVAGKRTVNVRKKHSIEAAEITMGNPTLDAPGLTDPKSNLTMKPEGARLDAKDIAEVKAEGDVTLRSQERAVTVEAEHRLLVTTGSNWIELDLDGTITVHAEALGGVVLVCGDQRLTLRAETFELKAGDALLQGAAATGALNLAGSAVKLDFEGEAHLNAGLEVDVAKGGAPPAKPLEKPPE